MLYKKKTNCKNLILKLGDRGIFSARTEDDQAFSLDSFANNVKDAVGAGDALLAYSVLALKVSGNLVIASILESCSCL